MVGRPTPLEPQEHLPPQHKCLHRGKLDKELREMGLTGIFNECFNIPQDL